jgi:hypothetical protein
MSEPQRYVLGVAYQAGPDPRIAKGADGGRDCFTAEELEKAAWGFMKSTRDVGADHADKTEGAADVVESYIYRGPDWDLGDGVIIKSGDWLLGTILSEESWKKYESGEFTGFSPQGSAIRRSRSSE